MSLGAGHLRTRVVAYQVVGTKDATGEEVTSFQEVSPTYADIEEQDPTFVENEGYPSSSKSTSVRVRKTSNMLSLEHGDVFFHAETSRMFRIQGSPTIEGQRYAYLRFDTEVVRYAADQL